MPSIADLVLAWDLSANGPITPFTTFGEIHKRIVYYHTTHYVQYLPTLSVLYPDFETRLERWLTNVSNDEDRRLLFELLPRLAFFSREDFAKLNQSAFEGPILRWILEQSGTSLADPALQDILEIESHRHTWYCPLSDSMRINDFHNVNGIGGIDFRPDWRSLAEFGDVRKIQEYMRNRRDCNGPAPLKRVVILEDFIGSGVQAGSTMTFIRAFSALYPVLVVPLIVCPVGANAWRSIESPPQLTFSPVIELKDSDMITSSTLRGGSFDGKVADLAESTYLAVVGDGSAAPRPYGPYGFPPGNGTGAIVALYSNTPANSLPLIHHNSDTWSPIFPRSARVR